MDRDETSSIVEKDHSPPSEHFAEISSEHNSHAQKELGEGAREVQEAPPRDMKTVVWILVAASVFSATFLFALDNTIVADVQPNIIEDFGEVTKLPWISVAFPLGAVAMNLIW